MKERKTIITDRISIDLNTNSLINIERSRDFLFASISFLFFMRVCTAVLLLSCRLSPFPTGINHFETIADDLNEHVYWDQSSVMDKIQKKKKNGEAKQISNRINEVIFRQVLDKLIKENEKKRLFPENG